MSARKRCLVFGNAHPVFRTKMRVKSLTMHFADLTDDHLVRGSSKNLIALFLGEKSHRRTLALDTVIAFHPTQRASRVPVLMTLSAKRSELVETTVHQKVSLQVKVKIDAAGFTIVPNVKKFTNRS